jgi:hypothetical protein
MADNRNREEAVNTQLAILISGLGVPADGETIHLHGKHRPDVLFEMRGLRVIIEGKFSDVPGAEEIVFEDANKRVKAGIAHIAAGVVYPPQLRTTPTAKLLSVLESARLRFRIVSEAHAAGDWFEGSPAELMDAFRRAQEALAKDDIVEQTARGLSIQLEAVAALWLGQPGTCDRLSDILGITPPRGEKPELAHQRRETAAKVAALVLANALIFQEQLARTNGRIKTLSTLEKEEDILAAIQKDWRWTWQNVNYIPIFQLGERILLELPSSPQSVGPVRALLAEAKTICSNQAALRHDLMGRIYHWLLHHAKYLGTYYTSVSAATLLLKLTFAAKWRQDFGNARELADFKVADLACGTGTLLMAAAQALTDAYILACAEAGKDIDSKALKTLHETLMENVLHGYDVLPSAIHLTASTLAMLAPEVYFRAMNLYVMPMGLGEVSELGQDVPRLGSLDFLTQSEWNTQMTLDQSQSETIRTGVTVAYVTKARVPKLDLCVMNPPFVRSVGGNLLFGSLPDERGVLQKELKARVKLIGASATAGLGSVFVALADRCLAEHGRLAFVLPAALASGEAWAPTRKLIADRYHLETVVASHDAEHPNFSENTDLSELLFIARKRKQKEAPGPTKYVNLWRNPRAIHQGLNLANLITETEAVTSVTGAGLTSIRALYGKLGEMVTTPAPQGEENWTGALFAQTELLRVYWKLQNGSLHVPGHAKPATIAMCLLGEIGDLGYDRRDIHDAFEISYDDWSPYPAFWNHKADKVRTMTQSPAAHLLARITPAKGRKLKDATAVWSKAGHILLVERLWPVTHRVLAIGFDREVLGNTWWALRTNNLSTAQEKALLLWLNSSLSLLLYFGRRVTTRSAWMQMKKPAWLAMPVLDVRALTKPQLTALSKAYDRLSGEALLALASLDHDQTRKAIDDALSKALGLPDLAPIRELLAREPGLNARDINPRSKRGESIEDEDV